MRLHPVLMPASASLLCTTFERPERSGFNTGAPVLDKQTILEVRSRHDLPRNMRVSFLRMLAFFNTRE
jgi:hypothetical protein